MSLLRREGPKVAVGVVCQSRHRLWTFIPSASFQFIKMTIKNRLWAKVCAYPETLFGQFKLRFPQFIFFFQIWRQAMTALRQNFSIEQKFLGMCRTYDCLETHCIHESELVFHSLRQHNFWLRNFSPVFQGNKVESCYPLRYISYAKSRHTRHV